MRVTSSSGNPPLDQFHLPQSNDFAQKRPILLGPDEEQGVVKSPSKTAEKSDPLAKSWLALHPRLL